MGMVLVTKNKLRCFPRFFHRCFDRREHNVFAHHIFFHLSWFTTKFILQLTTHAQLTTHTGKLRPLWLRNMKAAARTQKAAVHISWKWILAVRPSCTGDQTPPSNHWWPVLGMGLECSRLRPVTIEVPAAPIKRPWFMHGLEVYIPHPTPLTVQPH